MSYNQLMFLLSWLSKLVSSLLVSVLFVLLLANVLDATIFNSDYLKDKLKAANTYERTAGTLAEQVAANSEQAPPEFAEKLKQVITPTVLEQKTTDALDQLEAYYKEGAPEPKIDISDIVAQAQASGIPIEPNSEATQPITFGNNQTTRNIAGLVDTAKLVGLILAIVLAGILVLIATRTHNFKPVANIGITLGISLGGLALFLILAPQVAEKSLNFGNNAFAEVGREVVGSIAKDVGMRLGLFAIVALLLGIGGRIFLRRRKAVKQDKLPEDFRPSESSPESPAPTNAESLPIAPDAVNPPTNDKPQKPLQL